MMSLVVVTVLSLLMLGYFATEIIYSSLYEARRQKVQDIVETAVNITNGIQKEVEAGRIEKKDGLRRIQYAILQMRYGKNNSDYLFAQDMNGFGVIHPVKKFIGADMKGTVGEKGKYLIKEMLEVANTKGNGFVEYYWVKKDASGNEKVVKKISYVKKVPFWDMYLGTGIYIDDVEEEYKAAVTELAKIASIFIILAIALVLIISKNITGALN
ncbi:MAG: hypothetical protein GY793_03675, partial [Proteobacteria bacterium]|nr:hypothetical protein [Pseudomonadota bacterium]